MVRLFSIARVFAAAFVAMVILTTGTTAVAEPVSETELGATPSSGAQEVPESVSDSIVRLYYAVFDRAPDPDGLAYWVGLYTSGTSLEAIAIEFITSQEWQTAQGDADDDVFINLLYTNVLHRPADDAGRRYWIGVLDDGFRRSELLTFFSESAEFVAHTQTVLPTSPTQFPAVPADSGSGRRIVYDNANNRVWMVEANNEVVDSYLVSGRADTPSPGTYQVFSKSPVAWAGHDGITMQHMVRFTYGRSLAIGFHSIPRYQNGEPMQTVAELGTYQSAGCIRQQDHKAKALYEWAEIGTTVVVLN